MTRRLSVLCFLAWLGAAGVTPALGSLIVTVGAQETAPALQFTFPITVTGGDPIDGVVLDVLVGDGGLLGGPTPPVITAVALTAPGTVFAASNNGEHVIFNTASWATDSTTTVSPTVLSGSGVLAFVTLNISGYAPGTVFPIQISNLFDGALGDVGGSSFPGFAGAATFVNGTVTITPEPATLLLFAIAAPWVLIRRSRRRSGLCQ